MFLSVLIYLKGIIRKYRPMNKTIYSLLGLVVALFLVAYSCNKDDSSPLVIQSDGIQEELTYIADTIRMAVEAEIGKVIPTLNVFIQTDAGSWFASSSGEGYEPITENTFFRFASNSKNFTSAAALQMQQDGWLNIDDKIGDTILGTEITYVPNSAEWNIPYKDQITIKMLLNHTAGVYDVDNDTVPGYLPYSYTMAVQELEPDHQFTATELVNQIAINNLYYFEPGQSKQYSNTGYTIVGELIGRVYSSHKGSEMHLTDYLHDKLNGAGNPVPLEIYFPYLASDQAMEIPYSCGNEYYVGGEVREICAFNMSAQVAEGNGYTTMKNLNTYIRSLLKGENVLTAESVELMKTSVSVADPNYGLGCFYKENLGYGHNGARVGNISLMFYDPENDVSIVAYISALDEAYFVNTYFAIQDLAYAARELLGYPGKPVK